jgi:hypothetical protein
LRSTVFPSGGSTTLPPFGDVSRLKRMRPPARAIVIVGGLIIGMAINIFLLPALYVGAAGHQDALPTPESTFEEAA